MIQAISIESLIKDTKTISKSATNDNNVDFLGLLLKNIDKDEEQIIDKPTVKDKKSKEVIDELLEDKEFKNPIVNILNKDETIVNEIKNILTSKIKQENIVLSKQDEKEFRKIDNLKDLFKFADKKGLNIKEMKFEIEKSMNKKFPQLKQTISKFDELLSKTKLNTQNILQMNSKSNPKTEIQNKDIKDNNIKLENILKQPKLTKSKQNQDIEISNSSKMQENKLNEKSSNILETILQDKNTKNKEIKLKDDKLTKKDFDKKLQTQIDIKNEKEIKKELKSQINEKSLEIKDKLTPKENQKVEIKNENLNLNIQTTPQNELKIKSIKAKETIKNFNQNLDEAIKNYKPPVSKVNIELNPQNLGKVEVTIIQRGKNIQVNMNTDQSNIQLFQNHQAEFRQALSNIGFSNIDMNFNSNQDKERKQNQAKKTYKENEEIEKGEIEIIAEYKYA